MSTQPPPIPTLSLPGNNNTFAKRASLACLAAPIVVLGLLLAKGLLGTSLPKQDLALVTVVVEGVSCLIVLVGLILGMLSLGLMRSGGRAGIVFRSLAGIIMICLLGAIAVPNFVRARTIARQRVETAKEIRQAAKEFQQKSIATLTNGGSQKTNFEQFQQSLNDAAQKASGDVALAIKATQMYAGRIQALQLDYEQASADLTAARVLATSNLVDRAQLADRKAVVEKFLQCNQALADYLNHAPDNYRSNLAAAHISNESIGQLMIGFEKTSSPQRPYVAEIREQDDRMGQAMLGVLGLLETNWGHWHYNATGTPHLLFDDRAVLRQYNLDLTEIKEASQNQAASQRQLVAVMQQNPRQ